MTDLVERLREYASDDHERGCSGRYYDCHCGYDDKRDQLIDEAVGKIDNQQAEIERLCEANELMLTDIRRTDVDMLAFKAEIERLKEKCDRQAMVIRRIYVDEFPDTWFAWHGFGEKDQNGLPQYIEVVPAHGVGWTQVYERTERTISMEGS